MATLLEYALLLHPGKPDARSSPTGVAAEFPEGKFLSMTVPRDPAHRDVVVAVEASTSPAGPWTVLAASVNGAPFSGPGYVSGDAPVPGLKSVLIRDVSSLSTASRRFLRIRASR